jgi:hypothetical protein
MGLGVQRAGIPMALLIRFEPGLGVEGFRLYSQYISHYFRKVNRYLLHGSKKLLATPTFQFPVIIVLFGTSDAQCTIASTRTAEKPATTEFHLAIIDSRHRVCNDVPVGLGVEVV